MLKNNISEINIIYDIYKEEIIIFGSKFVENNKNKCKMIIDEEELELSDTLCIENNKKKRLKIRLKGINKVTDMSCIFNGCSSL